MSDIASSVRNSALMASLAISSCGSGEEALENVVVSRVHDPQEFALVELDREVDRLKKQSRIFYNLFEQMGLSENQSRALAWFVLYESPVLVPEKRQIQIQGEFESKFERLLKVLVPENSRDDAFSTYKESVKVNLFDGRNKPPKAIPGKFIEEARFAHSGAEQSLVPGVELGPAFGELVLRSRHAKILENEIISQGIRYVDIDKEVKQARNYRAIDWEQLDDPFRIAMTNQLSAIAFRAIPADFSLHEQKRSEFMQDLLEWFRLSEERAFTVPEVSRDTFHSIHFLSRDENWEEAARKSVSERIAYEQSLGYFASYVRYASARMQDRSRK